MELVISAIKNSFILGLYCVYLQFLLYHHQVADWCLRCMCLLLAQSEECVHRVCAANACDVLPVNMQVSPFYESFICCTLTSHNSAYLNEVQMFLIRSQNLLSFRLTNPVNSPLLRAAW